VYLTHFPKIEMVQKGGMAQKWDEGARENNIPGDEGLLGN
jgi:hypothetical protein